MTHDGNRTDTGPGFFLLDFFVALGGVAVFICFLVLVLGVPS